MRQREPVTRPATTSAAVTAPAPKAPTMSPAHVSRLPIGVRVSRRKRVHRVGGEADDRDDAEERRQLGPLPQQAEAVTDPGLFAARPLLAADGGS